MNPSTERPGVPADASDLDLLRAFEPIVAYTKGESFFPIDVESHMQHCSLWVHQPDGKMEMLVPEGELDIARLIEPRAVAFGAVKFLRFVGALSLTESAQVLTTQARRRATQRDGFRAGQGRLARGGYLARLADALFTATLVVRGHVPGATAAAAEIEYRSMLRNQERYVYHGRVARHNDWTILQYWYFYSYNNWRSGFQGVNDHESDWEMVTIYLYEERGCLTPEWIAYASHDFQGDDLRRRWDDQDELDLVEGHPVVFAGAGSHASYFRKGEYQAAVNIPLPRWAMQAGHWIRAVWMHFLGAEGEGGNPFRIPFVDYARGDGLRIGSGQAEAWTPALIDEHTAWVRNYQGLWGLYAKDPISGENAPAGPMYNRDGSPRDAWAHPLGFAGLDKVPPPPKEIGLLEERTRAIESRQAELERDIPEKVDALRLMGTEAKAMVGNPHLARQYDHLQNEMSASAEQVLEMRREESRNGALLDSLQARLTRLKAGVKDPPRAHTAHLASPVSRANIRFNRLAEGWAAASMSLILILIGGILLVAPQYIWAGLAIMCVFFVLVEAVLRGVFSMTLASVSLLLALLTAVLLVIEFWQQVLAFGLFAVAAYLLVQKIAELRS
jgi:hypothetical protein